jgi:hypothetical protein
MLLDAMSQPLTVSDPALTIPVASPLIESWYTRFLANTGCDPAANVVDATLVALRSPELDE